MRQAHAILSMHDHPSNPSKPHLKDDPITGQVAAMVEQLQDELDSLQQQLAWSNRLGQLGLLTAALAHETNNFLTPVRSYAQLALANPEDADLTQRALQAAVEGTKKVTALTDRTIGLASPNAAIQTDVCQANEVIESAIAALMPTIKQQGVNVLARVEPVQVGIDALALEQVLINLISNACHAMAEVTGRRQVLIEAKQGDGRVQLLISDTGPGIPAEVRGDLFKAFVTSKTEGPTPGSGLGLSICKQLIELAGGQLALASSSEQGSVFKIDLPQGT